MPACPTLEGNGNADWLLGVDCGGQNGVDALGSFASGVMSGLYNQLSSFPGSGRVTESMCNTLKNTIGPLLQQFHCPGMPDVTIYAGPAAEVGFFYTVTEAMGIYIDSATGDMGCYRTGCKGGGLVAGFSGDMVVGVLAAGSDQLPGDAWAGAFDLKVAGGVGLTVGLTSSDYPFVEVSTGGGLSANFGSVLKCGTDVSYIEKGNNGGAPLPPAGMEFGPLNRRRNRGRLLMLMPVAVFTCFPWELSRSR